MHLSFLDDTICDETGMVVKPSDQVIRRLLNAFTVLCITWSYSLAKPSTFELSALSMIESSTAKV